MTASFVAISSARMESRCESAFTWDRGLDDARRLQAKDANDHETGEGEEQPEDVLPCVSCISQSSNDDCEGGNQYR
jgi:hypothetical protein